MKTFVKLVACWLFLACGSLLWANGAAWRTGVASTGNGSASNDGHSTEVTIEEENLTIDLHQEYAAVEVRYVMRNTGSRVKQDFFFPMEMATGDSVDYQIMADGKELKWEPVKALEEKKEKTAPVFFAGRPLIKSWKKSKIPFSTGQTQEVVVRYKTPYERESWQVSDNGAIGSAIFAYSLSPAATWKGSIGKGKVVINILHSEPKEVIIRKPKQRFAKVTDTHYEWSFQELKPTLDDDIQIFVHQGYEHFPASDAVGADRNSKTSGEYMICGNRYFFLHTDYNPVASSTLKPDGEHNYEVKNIKERWNRDYTWAEGVDGDGIGESISLTVKRPLPLDAILIVPGDWSSTRSTLLDEAADKKRGQQNSLWWLNNRVAQLEITLNGEYTFTVAIPDELFHDPYPILVSNYAKPVNSIKLVIKGVYRGMRYQDTCISSVQLRAKLTNKPKRGPCR